MLILFNNLTEKDKSVAIERLIKGSTPTQDFFFMVILSILTATFGLLLNNVAIIIGSMLIAPILYPILSLALGIIISDFQLIARAGYTILKSALFGISASALVTILFSSHFTQITSEIVLRVHPTLPYVIVAIIAGFAGAFALVKPQLSETLPGIAISVALIPPLAVTGIGIAKFNVAIISGSLVLFLINAVGIMFAGMITFSLMNFYVKRREARETVEKEDRKAERDHQKAKEKAQRQS